MVLVVERRVRGEAGHEQGLHRVQEFPPQGRWGLREHPPEVEPVPDPKETDESFDARRFCSVISSWSDQPGHQFMAIGQLRAESGAREVTVKETRDRRRG